MKDHVLIVDNETEIRDLLHVVLERAGMRTTTADSGITALRCIEADIPDLIILDIMMEQLDGFELLSILRERELTIPILLLSAKAEDSDKVHGFGLGADDYVTKPFSPVEMVARVRAHLRSNNSLRHPSVPSSIPFGIFNLEIETQTLYKRGKPISLSSTEASLCGELMKYPNKVFTKAQLFHAVWHHSKYDENALNVYISRLRHKMEDNPKSPAFLQTGWGIGYRLVMGDTEDEAEN